MMQSQRENENDPYLNQCRKNEIYEVSGLVSQENIPHKAFSRMINFNDSNVERQRRRTTKLKKKNEQDIQNAISKYLKSA